jgi:hypothetical protein
MSATMARQGGRVQLEQSDMRLALNMAKMAPQIIRRHTGQAKEQVHLPPPDAESGLQSRLNLHPARHPPQPVTLSELNLLKSSICLPDIHIRIHLFPVWNIQKMMRILSTIPILIQIC